MTFPIMPTFYSGSRAFAADLEAMARRLDALNVTQPTASSEDAAVTDGTTTSTSFTNSLTTTLIRGCTFVAPSSGVVYVIGLSSARNGNAGAFVLMDFEVRQGITIGSGTLQRGAQEQTTGGNMSDSAGQQVNAICKGRVAGLTPGNSYNAALMFRVTAGTGTVNRRSIEVVSVA